MCIRCAGLKQDIRELRVLVERLRARIDVAKSHQRNNFEEEAKELRAEVAQLRAKLQSALDNRARDSRDSGDSGEKVDNRSM